MADRWTLTLGAPLGQLRPASPPIPGRVHCAADLPPADGDLAGIALPTKLGLLLGIKRQAAHLRLKAAARNLKQQGESR